MREKKQSFTLAVVFTLLSATGLTFTGFLGQILIHKMALTAVIFWRFFISFFIATGLLAFLDRLQGAFPVKNPKMHFFRALLVLTAQYSFYFYMENNNLFNAMVLLNTGPLFIPLIEWIFLRTRIGLSTWFSLILSFFGVLCVLQPDKGIFSWMSCVGLLSGIAQGSSQVVFGLNSKAERSDLGVLYLFGASSLLSLVPYLLFHTTMLPNHSANLELLSLLFLVCVATLCNQTARAEAYQHSTPSRVACFLYFSILLAGILDWVVFNQVPNTLSIIGAFLVILGGIAKIYLRYLILKNKKK